MLRVPVHPWRLRHRVQRQRTRQQQRGLRQSRRGMHPPQTHRQREQPQRRHKLRSVLSRRLRCRCERRQRRNDREWFRGIQTARRTEPRISRNSGRLADCVASPPPAATRPQPLHRRVLPQAVFHLLRFRRSVLCPVRRRDHRAGFGGRRTLSESLWLVTVTASSGSSATAAWRTSCARRTTD